MSVEPTRDGAGHPATLFESSAELDLLEQLPNFRARREWFLTSQPDPASRVPR